MKKCRIGKMAGGKNNSMEEMSPVNLIHLENSVMEKN